MSQAGIINLSGGPHPTIETLTGNTGGPIGPTGFNINVLGDGTTCTVSGNPGTSTLTVSVLNDSFTWTEKAATFDANIQNGYFCNAALTVNLPPNGTFATPLTIGNTIIIYVDTSSQVIIQAGAGQQIEISRNISSVGGTATAMGGAPGSQGNIVTLVYKPSDTTWHAISSQGTFTTA